MQQSFATQLQVLLAEHQAQSPLALVQNTQLDSDLRVKVCWLLGHLKIKGAKAALITLLADEDSAVGHQAMIALGQLRSKRAINPLMSIVASSTDATARKLAVYALGEIGDGRVLDFLLSILTNPNENPEVRGQIAESIVGLGSEKVLLPILLKLLSDDSSEVRFWVIYALGQLGDSEIIPFLELLVNDSAMVEKWWTVGQEANETIQYIKMRQEWLATDT